MSNRVTRFEIPCDEPEKTMKFFKDVFNWTFQKFGDNDYWFAITGNEKEPGINGTIMKKRDPQQPVVNSISVLNINPSKLYMKNLILKVFPSECVTLTCLL